jgi:hypothetical protein
LFNVTGGYKAIIPILTLIAGRLGDVQVVCLFEDSEELLYQPVMPIRIEPPELEEELLYAGTGDAERDPLRPGRFPSAEAFLEAREPAWRPYFAASGPPALSALGLAVHEVLWAKNMHRKTA